MRSNVSRMRVRVALAALLVTVACAPSSLVDVQATSTLVDPEQVKTAAGATQLYNSAVLWTGFNMVQGYNPCQSDIVCTSGLFTDELSATPLSTSSQLFDQRVVNASTNYFTVAGLYITLHQARTRLQQARQALQLYAADVPSVPKAWQGQLFALEGYTVVWLAELYCSGIPLTSVPLVGPSQPTRGFTTQELFEHAIVLFDSAIVAGADSTQFVNLAKVGKGRALLGLGRFAEAAQATQDVPTQFVYTFTALPSLVSNNMADGSPYRQFRIQDREGGNGLVWTTDPRTVAVHVSAISDSMWLTAKYNFTASGTVDPTTSYPTAPIRIADGLEARLIESEAALAAGDANWLTMLNTLRSTCIGAAACAPVPTLTTTNLPDTLSDPGDPDARLDLVMRERAMWLYLTGHRQGDLRRLAHVYRRNPQTLWPTGIVNGPAFPPQFPTASGDNGQLYGTDMVYLPSANERANNPLYTGCSDMNP